MTWSSDAQPIVTPAPVHPWIEQSERTMGLLTRPKLPFRRAAIWFVAMLTTAIGLADYVSGIRVSLTVVYLRPVLLATAWFGWQAGTIAAVGSVLLRVAGDHLALDEGSLPLWSLWNSFSALLTFLVIVWGSSNLLRLFRRLEQRVIERTAALSIAAERRRQLEHDLLMIAARERNAMGQELHDDICQHLVGTTLAARVLPHPAGRVGRMTPPTRVFLVDDHPLVRDWLKNLLRMEQDFDVVGEADNPMDALSRMQAAPPDVAVVDLSLRRRAGLDLIKTLRIRLPDVRVLVLKRSRCWRWIACWSSRRGSAATNATSMR